MDDLDTHLGMDWLEMFDAMIEYKDMKVNIVRPKDEKVPTNSFRVKCLRSLCLVL